MKKFLIVLGSALLVTFAVAQQGPIKESGETVARPKKKGGDAAEPEAPAKIPSKFNKKDSMPLDGTATFKSDVSTVSVDVAVMDKNGNFIPNIPRGNFRVLEDGAPQQVSGFSIGEAPMTICMVIEFSNLFQQYYSQGWYETLTYSYSFIQTLKKEDFLAVVAFDLRPEILSDFTTDRSKAQEAMQRLRIPAYSESNLYDALTDTAERMQEIEGRKAILFIGSGRDTFSKITFDQTRKKLQNASVPIYSISTMQILRERMDASNRMGAIQRLDWLQADNQMKTFTRETGGQAFLPRFMGEMPNIFRAVHQSLRNQYMVTYQPSNQLKDGKFRKIKVELVNPATGEPLSIVDEKGKPMKYTIIAKQGYTAPREVE